jgi:Saf4/Yju2 protein
MGERKVINKYIPADFDPALVPRGTKLSKKDGTVPVRMMLPFSIQCDTCNTFLYRGRKFNSKKEPMGGPSGRYLGIQRWRFYIKCTHCSRTITFLTDPQNADYEMETGASRNYEVYKDKAKTEETSAAELEELEKEDKLKALENRILDSQREMADLDNLEEIKAMNKRHLQLLSSANNNNSKDGDNASFGADAKALLQAREASQRRQKQEASLNEHGLTADEEALVQSIKFGGGNGRLDFGGTVDGEKDSNSSGDGMGVVMRRLNDEDERKLEEKRKEDVAVLEQRRHEMTKKATTNSKLPAIVPIVKVKRKRVPVQTSDANNNNNSIATKKSKSEPIIASTTNTLPAAAKAPSSTGLAGLLGDYGSDSDSE